MRILRDLSAIPASARHAVVALGNFDGVHLGHQAILRHAVELAKQSGRPAAALTFEPHPREFFSGFRERLRLCPFRAKVQMLAELGMEYLFVVRFNQGFARISAEQFMQQLLHEQLQLSHVVTGDNFCFGQGRAGDHATLQVAGRKLGFQASAHHPVHDAAGHLVSSSAIRGALAAGDTREASALLGRAYAITGRVRRGEQRGRTLGFPTLNLSLDHLFVPKHGVYAARVQLDGRWHDAAASIGVKPTFGEVAPLLEAHLFDVDAQCYGQRVQVELRDYIRAEEKFATAQALVLQMEKDCQRVKEILSSLPRRREPITPGLSVSAPTQPLVVMDSRLRGNDGVI